MSLKDFHCDFLELRFRFESEEIDENAFLEASGVAEENREEYIDEEGDLGIGFDFDPREQITDYHAHVRVWLYKKGGGSVIINYHDTPIKTKESDPKLPHVEEFMPWLGRFFSTDKFTAHIHSSYLFNNSFSPVIALPFPLVTTEKEIAGSLVTGLSVLLPKEQAPEQAIIQKAGDDTYCALTTTSEIHLKDFDLAAQLKILSDSVNRLVKRQVKDNEKNDTQKNQE